MGKLREPYEDAKIIFKKSNNTMTTHSRTCSGVSQFQKRDEFLKSPSRSNNKQCKMDFSIETDICKLRRHYGNKRSRLSDKISVNKYSAVPNDELKADRSASGDSDHKDSVRPRKDIAGVLLNNLKGLINCLIENYVLETGENEQKKQTVLDSIYHQKKEIHVNEIASGSTYVLNKSLKNPVNTNKSVETASVICQYCKRSTSLITKRSTKFSKISTIQSCPGSIKKLRGISTLSMPKTLNVTDKNIYKVKKIRRKHIILTLSKSNKLLDCSSFNLLAVSTKSFTKRFVTYDVKGEDKKEISRKSICKMTSNPKFTKDGACVRPNIGEPGDMYEATSLVKTIYADNDNKDQAVYDNGSKHDELKINEENDDTANLDERDNVVKNAEDTNCIAESNATIVCNSVGDSNEGNVICTNKITQNSKMRRRKFSKIKKHTRNTNQTYNFNSSQPKESGQDYLQCLKSLFQYLSENKHMKFEINVNINPDLGKEMKNAFACVSEDFIVNSPRIDNTMIYNVKHSNISIEKNEEGSPEIIPILDGAASQTKYICHDDTTTVNSSRTKITNNTEDIERIASVKDVVSTVEVTSEEIRQEIDKYATKSKQHIEKYSKGIQISKDFNKGKQPGLKLSKEPKKDIDFYARMMKRSSSYNVIESESVIKVTDMTLPYDVEGDQQFVDEALTCSLPKPNSLFDTNEYVTYFCEKCSDCSSQKSKGDKCDKKSKNGSQSLCECDDTSESGDAVHSPKTKDSGNCFPECSSISLNDGDDVEKVVVLHKKGMGFGEGLVFCLILWIPVVIIACLFYSYVIKDMIFPPGPSLRSRKANTSSFRLDLSDLGF